MEQKVLHKFFRGEASQEEKRRIKEWVESSNDNSKQFFQERKLFDTLILSKPYADVKERRINIFKEVMRIAAAVIIAVFCTSLGFLYFNYNNEDSFQEVLVQSIHVPIGQRINIDLADGTNVWLNSGSSFSYPVNFGKGKQRRVKLDGEGYFKVAHNADMPFVVETFALDVIALGTEFNVSADNKDRTFETCLIEGSVAIDNSEGKRLATLTPNYRLTLSGEGVLHKNLILDYDVFRWKEGLYCFKGKQLSDILTDLERYYDVSIQLKGNKYNKVKLTGKFRVKDGISSVMQVLQSELGFTFTYDKELNVIEIK